MNRYIKPIVKKAFIGMLKAVLIQASDRGGFLHIIKKD